MEERYGAHMVRLGSIGGNTKMKCDKCGYPMEPDQHWWMTSIGACSVIVMLVGQEE